MAIWSVYARTLNGGDRTNNFAESAHRRLQRAFGCAHPSLWRFVNDSFLTIVLFSFIDTSRREQKNVDADYTQFTLGRNPPPKAKKYRDADQRII